MVIKKLFSLQNVMKKLFEMHYSSENNCLQVPKMVTPDKKNNGSSLNRQGLNLQLARVQIQNPSISSNLIIVLQD